MSSNVSITNYATDAVTTPGQLATNTGIIQMTSLGDQNTTVEKNIQIGGKYTDRVFSTFFKAVEKFSVFGLLP